MPQLHLAPWFMIAFVSWLVFLVLLPPKVLAHTFPNEPTPQSTEMPKTTTWSWPWH